MTSMSTLERRREILREMIANMERVAGDAASSRELALIDAAKEDLNRVDAALAIASSNHQGRRLWRW